MTIDATTVELARRTAAEHHPRCATRDDGECDCYAADRLEHRFASALVELVDRVGEAAVVGKAA